MINSKIVSIDELRSNLADIVNRVTYAKDRVIVKKYNRDAVIIISLDEYEKLMDPTKRLSDTKWKNSFKVIDEIRAKMPKVNPQELEKIIDEAVKEVRAKKRTSSE